MPLPNVSSKILSKASHLRSLCFAGSPARRALGTPPIAREAPVHLGDVVG